MAASRLFRSRKASAALSILLVLVATGCGGNDADPAARSPEAGSNEGLPPAEAPVATPGPITAVDRAALDNPCSLLSAAEVRQITGRQDYMEGIPGDALGEGAGGGASCQWSGPAFGGPPERSPLISVVVVPPQDGRRWTERVRGSPRPTCTYDPAPGAGEGAFFEDCQGYSQLPLYVPSRAVDIIVAIEIRPPATSASVRPTLVQVANTVVAKLR